MKSHARRWLIAATLSTTATLLAGCSLLGLDEPEDSTAENDALATKLVACLIAEGQTAKIIEGGMVALLLPSDSAGSDGEESFSESEGTGTSVVMQDEDGEWQASSSAESYPEDGGLRDAWATCEEQVPGFEQPAPEFEGDSTTQAEQVEQALAFAECARENGFTDFPDPDDNGAMNLPDDITEDGFRQLLEDCWDLSAPMGVVMSQETAEKLDFDLMAVMQDFMEAHPGSGGTGGVTGGNPGSDE